MQSIHEMEKWQHHCQSSRGRRKRWLTLCGMQYILSQELTTEFNQSRDDISVSQCITVNTSMGRGRTHKHTQHKNMPEQIWKKIWKNIHTIRATCTLIQRNENTQHADDRNTIPES